MNLEKIHQAIKDFRNIKSISGISVCVIKEHNSQYFFQGMSGKRGSLINENSLFEIGSLTKLFTELLIEKTFSKKEISSHQTIVALLPRIENLHQVKLVDVLRHVSGFPRLPDNLNPTSLRDPYIDYSRKDFMSFLKTYKKPNDIKNKFEYSNTGFAFLGLLLSIKKGKKYRTLIKEYITKPWGLKNTFIEIPSREKEFLVSGYNFKGERSPRWNMKLFESAGGIVSNIKDMGEFLKLLIHRKQPLHCLMKSQNFFWHNGQTGGCSSFLVFDPKKQIGIVILANKTEILDHLAKDLLKIIES